GREDRTALGTSAVVLLVLAAVMAIFPRSTAWTLSGLLGWFGLVVGVRAILQARVARKVEAEMEALMAGRAAADLRAEETSREQDPPAVMPTEEPIEGGRTG